MLQKWTVFGCCWTLGRCFLTDRSIVRYDMSVARNDKSVAWNDTSMDRNNRSMCLTDRSMSRNTGSVEWNNHPMALNTQNEGVNKRSDHLNYQSFLRNTQRIGEVGYRGVGLYEKERIPKVEGHSLCPTWFIEMRPFAAEMRHYDAEMCDSDRELQFKLTPNGCADAPKNSDWAPKWGQRPPKDVMKRMGMAVPWVPFQRRLCQRGHTVRGGTVAARGVVC